MPSLTSLIDTHTHIYIDTNKTHVQRFLLMTASLTLIGHCLSQTLSRVGLKQRYKLKKMSNGRI